MVNFKVKTLLAKVPLPDAIELINSIIPPDTATIAAACHKSTYIYCFLQ